MFQGCNYISEFFDKSERRNIYQSFAKLLGDGVFGNFDAIACRGTSGLLVAPWLAYEFDKELIISRKKTDSHHNGEIDYKDTIRNFIIVDDFACSGRTIENILNSIEKVSCEGSFSPKYLGCYFWVNNRHPANKEKICISDEKRFQRVAKNITFTSRVNGNYITDKFNGYTA